jgi:hypothetical protein
MTSNAALAVVNAALVAAKEARFGRAEVGGAVVAALDRAAFTNHGPSPSPAGGKFFWTFER